jgi:hypothetical protein
VPLLAAKLRSRTVVKSHRKMSVDRHRKMSVCAELAEAVTPSAAI